MTLALPEGGSIFVQIFSLSHSNDNMAAAAEIIGEPLPEHWTYGVTADGRVFYIDDLNERTSWVHPVTNKPAASGLLSDPELPGGWEWSITPEGVLYYVDHNTQRTTFIHPLTKKAAPPFNDAAQSIESQRPSSLKPVPQQVNKRASGRQRVIDKGPEAQRMSNSKVILTGWLTVQELNSIRSWKRRWCVHADYGLFLYRDATEQQSVGSILLPSYTIRPCDASDPIHKRYAFKAEHANLRTQYFIAESKENMDEWVKVLNQSAQMLNSEPVLNNSTELQRPASPENDNDYYVLARDPEHNGELRYQRTNYGKEESLPEYYPNDGQSAASSKEYSPYSNIASPEFSHRNSFSPNHMSAAQPGSPPPLFHNQHHNSYGEAPHSRSSYSSVESPYNQRHDYNYQPMKPPERNSDSSPRSAHNRQSVSSSVGPYHEIASRYNISYSSLDFNAMYHHNGHAGEHPSPPGSYQSIGSPRSLDNANMTIPKSLEDGFYSSIPPSSQNNHSRHSLSSPHSSEVYQNHRNLSPLERGPNRDSYSSRGDQNPSQLSYEMYTHNGGHSGDSPNFDVSQDSFAMNHSDVAAPYSKRLYGAQTDLSKLVMDSDPGDQKSEDMESHHEYATICRIRSESMCTSPEIMRSRPNSISTSQHGSETEVPKRTSVQRLQEMHLRELQRHSPLSKSFSSGNVPNYHNISQTLSQDADHEDLEVAQSYIEGSNQQDPPSKRQSTSSLPQTEYQSENGALSPTSAPQNQIVYDYQGTGHDSTLPTQSSQGLSVKPHKYPNSTDLSMNDRTHNNYINVDNGHSYLDYVDKPYSPEFISADTSRDLHNMDYQAQSPSFDRNNHHISNDSLLDSQKPPSMDYKPMEPDPYNTRPASEISEPYINYQKAANLRSAAGTPTEKHRLQNEVRERNINTVKEDPNMPDTAVIETTHPLFAKLKASQGRLRMSISAGDLLGKTHEELVLLLIQLRRNKAHLEHCRESLRKQIDQLRPYEQEYKRQLRETNTILDFHLEDKHGHFLELKKQCGEVENKLEMYKPIENLVDNMVTMGSLYGGNNYMLATQYRKHILHPDEYIPPKKMLEFSRQHQEDAIIQKMERDVRELTDDEADLEEKLDRLCILDRLIQEQSFNVTSLREDKEALEKMLRDLHHEQNRPSDRSQQQMEHLANQQHTVDMELSRSMLQLAEASKKLEGLNAESSKLGHEIALLRSKVHGELSRSRSIPSLMGDPSHTRHKMEKDLYRVKDVMDNLNKEGARLSQALNTLKLPPETSEEMAASKKQKSSTYMETDLDSKESYDLSCETSATLSPEISSNIHYYDGQVGFVKYVRPSSPGHFVNDHNSHSSPVLLESHKEQPLHSHLPAHFKAGGQEVGVAVPVTSTLEGDSYEDENMWDISDADDNTKRFFGLLPKERPRAQTVRDVKRQAEQRRERGANEKFRGRMSDESDREVELGDLWRALPPNTSTADYLGRTNSPPELIPHSSYKLDKSSEELLFSPSISQSLEYPDYNTLPQSPLQSPMPSPPPLPTSMLSYNNQNNHFTEGISSIASPPPLPPTSPPPLPPLPQLQQLSPIQVPTTSSMVTDPEFIRRRSSLHSLPQRLLGPKPFTPYNSTNNTMVPLLHNYEDKDLPVETVLPMKITETKNPEINEPSVSSSVQTKNLFTAKPWATGLSVPKLKRSPRGRNRYLTISSSEPIKLEHVLQRQSSIMSSAGDLIPGATLINNMPDIVKSSTIDKFDEDTIDRELMKPEMVFIPERYMPDSDEEDLTEEEKEKRKAKSEKIRKVLTEQSIHSWTKQFPTGHPEKIHDHIAKERIVREHLLTVTQELAKEVTKKSKAAAVERRKTWSGTPSSDYLKAVFGEKDLYAEDIMSG